MVLWPAGYLNTGFPLLTMEATCLAPALRMFVLLAVKESRQGQCEHKLHGGAGPSVARVAEHKTPQLPSKWQQMRVICEVHVACKKTQLGKL